MALRVSNKLRLAVLQARVNGTRQYELARQAGLHQTVFSTLVCDIRPIQPNDPRVIAIGRVLGVPAAE